MSEIIETFNHTAICYVTWGGMYQKKNENCCANRTIEIAFTCAMKAKKQIATKRADSIQFKASIPLFKLFV